MLLLCFDAESFTSASRCIVKTIIFHSSTDNDFSTQQNTTNKNKLHHRVDSADAP